METQAKRRAVLLAAAAMGVPAFLRAQSAGKLPRIALLDSTEKVESMDEKQVHWGALLAELRRLGYVEGKTVAVERWSGNANVGSYPAMAQKLAASRPDVIVAWGFTMISAIASATPSIPVVGVGTIPASVRQSFARPGRNVTGVHTTFDQDSYFKLAELLRQLTKPGARAAWLGPQHQWDGELGRTARDGARKAGIELQPAIVASPVDETAVRAALIRNTPKVEGLYVSAAIELRPHRYLIAELARAARLPSVGLHYDDADAGLVLSYGADTPQAFQSAARYVERILKGAKPGDMAIEQPSKIVLVLNRRTASAIGIVVPQEIAQRADRVID